MRTLLGAAALFALLANAGCNGATPTPSSSSEGVTNTTPRVDWGMSLLASGTVGIDQFPAKFSFDVTAPLTASNCVNDFVVYNTSLPGVSGTTANIVAFNQLYSTQGSPGGFCDQDGPSVYWSYFTGTGEALTSVVLSGDGSKVAFVENAAGGATLRILKWHALQGSGAGSPAPVDQNISGSAWSTCVSNSCMASIPFNGAALDTNSAPFYDYNADVLYVGDNSGSVHKFTGVFNGTPAEVCATGCGVTDTHWPITVNAGAILTGPVYDGVSGNIFVGDSTGRLSFIQEVGSTVGGTTPCTAPCLNTVNLSVGTGGPTGTTGIVDAPVVDGTNGTVLAFNGNGYYLGISTEPGTVLQASTGLTGPASFWMGGNGVDCGTSPVCSPIYSGAFDNAYYTSSKPTLAGHMYVCGKNNVDNRTDRPAIFQLSFDGTTGVLTGVGPTTGPGSPLLGLVSGSSEACSPVTEIYNSNTLQDLIFFSIGDLADDAPTDSDSNVNPIPSSSGCYIDHAGCLISIDVTTPTTWPPATVTNTVPLPTAPVLLSGARSSSTSGIVVDNISTAGQAANIYFSLAGNSSGSGTGLPNCNNIATPVGCAVKLTQSALQ